MFRKILVMTCALLFSHATMAATADEAGKFVDNLGKNVVAVVSGTLAENQKQPQLQQMFTDNVDIAWMAKFALGHAWASAGDDQKTRYLEAYKQYLLIRYTTNFADYSGSKYVITGVKSELEGNFTVAMQIKSPKGGEENIQAGYRVQAAQNGQLKITDIIIEGVSLITTERADFASVVQQKGVDGLISDIEAKTKAEQQTPTKS